LYKEDAEPSADAGPVVEMKLFICAIEPAKNADFNSAGLLRGKRCGAGKNQQARYGRT